MRWCVARVLTLSRFIILRLQREAKAVDMRANFIIEWRKIILLLHAGWCVGGRYRFLPMTAIGKIRGNCFCMLQDCYTFAANFKMNEYESTNDRMVRNSGSAIARICVQSRRKIFHRAAFQSGSSTPSHT